MSRDIPNFHPKKELPEDAFESLRIKLETLAPFCNITQAKKNGPRIVIAIEALLLDKNEKFEDFEREIADSNTLQIGEIITELEALGASQTVASAGMDLRPEMVGHVAEEVKTFGAETPEALASKEFLNRFYPFSSRYLSDPANRPGMQALLRKGKKIGPLLVNGFLDQQNEEHKAMFRYVPEEIFFEVSDLIDKYLVRKQDVENDSIEELVADLGVIRDSIAITRNNAAIAKNLPLLFDETKGQPLMLVLEHNNFSAKGPSGNHVTPLQEYLEQTNISYFRLTPKILAAYISVKGK